MKLLFDTHTKNIKAKLPKYGEAFDKRLRDDLEQPFSAFVDKVESIRTSGRYSPQGERTELRLAARSFKEQLEKVKTATVTKLETQLAERRAAALKPRSRTTDPLAAILNEMKQRELRDHLRQLDKLELQVRLRQAVDDGAVSVELLEALEGAPAGFPIAPPSLIDEARMRIAEQSDPALSETAQLRDAYSYALGVVEQTLLTASGLSKLELGVDPTPASDARRPTLLLTGSPVDVVNAG